MPPLHETLAWPGTRQPAKLIPRIWADLGSDVNHLGFDASSDGSLSPIFVVLTQRRYLRLLTQRSPPVSVKIVGTFA